MTYDLVSEPFPTTGGYRLPIDALGNEASTTAARVVILGYLLDAAQVCDCKQWAVATDYPVTVDKCWIAVFLVERRTRGSYGRSKLTNGPSRSDCLLLEDQQLMGMPDWLPSWTVDRVTVVFARGKTV